jgi:chaperonin cofactor prefoldin
MSIKEWISNDIKSTLESNSSINLQFKEVIENNKKLSEDHNKILKKIEELNDQIYNKFKSMNTSSIEEIEVFFGKMKMVRNTWRNSDRFRIPKLYYLIENLHNNSYVARYCGEIIYEEKIEETINDLDKFIRFVDKI